MDERIVMKIEDRSMRLDSDSVWAQSISLAILLHIGGTDGKPI
jgi:hypothetical protein